MKKVILISLLFLIFVDIQFTTQNSHNETNTSELRESENQSEDQNPLLRYRPYHKPYQYEQDISTAKEIHPALLFLGTTVVRVTTLAAIIGAIFSVYSLIASGTMGTILLAGFLMIIYAVIGIIAYISFIATVMACYNIQRNTERCKEISFEDPFHIIVNIIFYYWSFLLGQKF